MGQIFLQTNSYDRSLENKGNYVLNLKLIFRATKLTRLNNICKPSVDKLQNFDTVDQCSC